MGQTTTHTHPPIAEALDDVCLDCLLDYTGDRLFEVATEWGEHAGSLSHAVSVAEEHGSRKAYNALLDDAEDAGRLADHIGNLVADIETVRELLK